MGRYKLGPQGAYFDPNDSGPDQASPDQIQQLQGQQAAPSPTGGYQPPTGGINPGPVGQPMPQPLPNIPGQPGWNGGFTGGQLPKFPGFTPSMDPSTNYGAGSSVMWPGGAPPWVFNESGPTQGLLNYNDFYNRIYQRFLPQQGGFGAALSPLYQGASLGLAK